MILGIDIGGTKINTGLFSAREKTLWATKKGYIAEISDLPAYIKETIEALCREQGVSPSEILSIGIGIPGTVSADGKKILKAPNISLLSDDLAEKLEDALRIPVAFVQDSRAAAWGEYLCGGGKGAKAIVCVTLGTGIGTDEDGYRYILGSKHTDVRPFSKELNAKFGGKGGGKPEMVQGSLVGNKNEIEKMIMEG